jgi:hypothetical protein
LIRLLSSIPGGTQIYAKFSWFLGFNVQLFFLD